MDISNIAPGTSKVEIKHPATGAPIGLTVELASIYDERFKAVERRITDDVMKKRVRGKVMQADQIDANRNELIAAVIIDWEWGNGPDGKPATFNGDQPKCTPAAKSAILAVGWIRDQIDAKLEETESFFRN